LQRDVYRTGAERTASRTGQGATGTGSSAENPAGGRAKFGHLADRHGLPGARESTALSRDSAERRGELGKNPASHTGKGVGRHGAATPSDGGAAHQGTDPAKAAATGRSRRRARDLPAFADGPGARSSDRGDAGRLARRGRARRSKPGGHGHGQQPDRAAGGV